MHWFLIPGNPPARYFYELWGDEIRSERPGATFAVSRYPDLLNKINPKMAMDTIFNHQMDELIKYYHQIGNRPVTLVGHSLGAYFALRILENAGYLLEEAVLVHPFLRAPGLVGKSILQSVGSLYGKANIQRKILEYRKLLEMFFLDLRNVTDEEIFQSFHLAHHEGHTIAKDTSFVEIKPEIRDKVSIYYTRDDHWCSQQVIDELRNQVYTLECSQPHGFVVDKNHRSELFQMIISQR